PERSPVSEAATIERVDALIAQGRSEEAVALTGAMVAAASPSLLALAAHAGALKEAGRHLEALAFDEQAVARFAGNGVAWHNYAATLDDLGRAEDAVAACERALSLGLDAPQTYAVLARARAAGGQHNGAAEAYRQSLARAPGDVRVATEYANHVWMTQGDVAAADAVLDRAFHAGAPPAPLLVAKSTLYDAAGQTERAAQLLDAASQRMADNPLIQMSAADLALRLGRLDDAERYIGLAQAVDPASRSVTQYAAILDLAHGRAGAALAKLRSALKEHPADQSLWGW